MQSIHDIDVSNTKVFVRLDLNLPVRDGRITDTTRLERALPTLTLLLDKGAAVIVASHFGRPQGKPNTDMSLRPVARALEQRLGRQVTFIEQVTGKAVEQAAQQLTAGDIMMIENLRFDPGEESNDDDFATRLASLAQVYVNDSFSCSHRAHASIEALAHRLPAVAGINLLREIKSLNSIFQGSRTPKAALVGGAKISTKLDLLLNLVNKVDYIILGGGMANTFLLDEGYEIGTSLCERNMLHLVADIRIAAEKASCTLVLPKDAHIATGIDKPESASECTLDRIPPHQMILDIGQDSIRSLQKLLTGIQTLLWNGPLGVFEVPPFDTGTNAIAQYVAQRCQQGQLLSVAGGGDTVSALNHAHVTDAMTYVSTAGGAFLEWIEGKELPGITALEQQQ